MPKRGTCTCRYDHNITDMFAEVFNAATTAENNAAAQDFCRALTHSERFGTMVDAFESGNYDPAFILSEAVRCGVAMGKKMTEISNLEAMVGYEAVSVAKPRRARKTAWKSL